MRKYRIKARNVANVTSTGSCTVIVELPIGPRYHHLIVQGSYGSGTNTIAGVATWFNDIRVKLNGRTQRQMTGTQLRALNMLNGAAYDAVSGEAPNTAPGASIPIFFAEPWRKDARDQDALAWPTQWKGGNFQSFQVEIDLGSATSAAALQVWAVVDDFVPEQSPQICKWLRQNFAASGSSFDITTFDRRDFLNQISLWAPTISSSGVLDILTLRLDGQILHELSMTANNALLTQYGMTPATGRYDIVLDHDDLLGSAVNLNGSRDIALTVTCNTGTMSSTAIAIVQRIGPPE